MVEGCLRQEVLYREGLALGLDRGDGLIRDRVIALVRTLVIKGAQRDLPPEKTLRDDVAQNKTESRRPRSYDLEHILLSDAERVPQREVQAALRVLEAGTEPAALGLRAPTPRQAATGRSSAKA